jgi:hypothetical protein
MSDATTKEDPFAELQDRLDHQPLTWSPKGFIDGIDVGQQHQEPKVAGVVEQVDVWESHYGPYPVVDLKLKDGTRVRIHGFSTVLKRRLGEIDPQPGELIGVSYLGEVASRIKGRKGYSNFAVVRAGGGEKKSLKQFAAAEDEDESTDDLGSSTIPEPPETDPEHGRWE